MSRIQPVNHEQSTGKVKELLDGVQAKLGMTPNMMRAMAQSPAVLEGYLNFSGALGGGKLPAKLREEIALAVGEANRCEYCVAAHTAIGGMVGLHADEIAAARQSSSIDTKQDAALKFARTLSTKRGEVTDAEVQAVKDAGYSEGEVAEIIAHVALNVFTNYFNIATQTEVDFPKVAIGKSA